MKNNRIVIISGILLFVVLSVAYLRLPTLSNAQNNNDVVKVEGDAPARVTCGNNGGFIVGSECECAKAGGVPISMQCMNEGSNSPSCETNNGRTDTCCIDMRWNPGNPEGSCASFKTKDDCDRGKAFHKVCGWEIDPVTNEGKCKISVCAS